MSDNDGMDELNAEFERTMAMASRIIGLTEQEVLALVDTTPAGYRIHFIEEGTDDGFRIASLDARRIYFFTKNGEVVRCGD